MSLLIKIYLVLSLLTLVSCIFTFREKEAYQKFIIAYLVLLTLTCIASVYVANVMLENNLFIFHIYVPIEYIILSFLYKNIIVNAVIKKMILLSIPFFVALSVCFSLFIQPPDTNNSTMSIIESVIMIFLSLSFLREILLFQQATALHKFPLFWINVGILVFFTGRLITEGMLSYLVSHSMVLARRIFTFGFVFKYLLFVLFIIGVFCGRPSQALLNRNR